MLYTHHCGELTIKNKGERVTLCAWVNSRRDHGSVIFVDLRDRSGLVQVVFAEGNQDVYKLADTLRSEFVIKVEGEVKARPEKMRNPKLSTGEIEIEAKELEILAQTKTPPFEIDKDGREVNEELRLKYRYLDLRRQRMLNNLILRDKVIKFIRDYLHKEGFLEIETPILTVSTPEGARDFLVPSRLQPGKFYALPQSPQQYKQLLMIAGIEKYFQVPRCFRDEDTRGDRQPEFTQLDLEMSFVEQEDILKLIEDLFISLVKTVTPEKNIKQIPFPRITYEEAMDKYKSDKPDLRKNKNDPDELAFAWIVDFPMFEWHEEEKIWGAQHHPFTSPKKEHLGFLKTAPEKVLANQYDLILNGYEIAGGSIRTHDPEILTQVFEVLGHTKEEVQKKFGHLLEAFQYGVPPHGGIASGLDRVIGILRNEPNIREVIAFPKTGDARDPMMGSPNEVDPKQLKELGIRL